MALNHVQICLAWSQESPLVVMSRRLFLGGAHGAFLVGRRAFWLAEVLEESEVAIVCSSIQKSRGVYNIFVCKL